MSVYILLCFQIFCIGNLGYEVHTIKYAPFKHTVGLPGGSDGKESACNVADLGLIPGSGRPLGKGNGYPLQYSCLENPMNRGAWQAI